MILFPVVLLVIFMIVQGALYYHARSVALSAAQEGARAARAETGTAEEGGAAAREFVDQAGGDDVMTEVSISPRRTATEVSITVTGRPLSVIPGLLNFQVSQTAQAPVARFTSPDGTP